MTVSTAVRSVRPDGTPLKVLLLSTYELGHQPFGLASPAAWLRAAGADVECCDLSVEVLTEASVMNADLIGFYLPMHTATRIAAPMIEQARAANPGVHICAYGLYASANAAMLRERGADTVLGGEFEEPLRQLCADVAAGGSNRAAVQTLPLISLARQDFVLPDRTGLPALARYAHLSMPDGSRRITGYTETTRGCKHMCRHCPVVPVYEGRFRVVQTDVVAADIASLVASGAEHITFGDPDFLNAPKHALDVVRRLASEFPSLSYDITVKVEHLVRHVGLLRELHDTGCVLVTSAVESFDEEILEIFDKQHSREDLLRAIEGLAEAGIALNPTFVAFTPWTTADGYASFLTSVHELGLVGSVAPVQYAVRLLVPAGSRLLEFPDTQTYLGAFDAERLCFDWRHPDPIVDELQKVLFAVTEDVAESGLSRGAVFDRIVESSAQVLGGEPAARLRALPSAADADVEVPHLSEPWFCCAEPVQGQLTPLF